MINSKMCVVFNRTPIKHYCIKQHFLRSFTTFTSIIKSESHSFEFPPAYDPKRVEGDRYEWWKNKGLFKSEETCSLPFSMLLPPPNITGTLHLGHTLICTVQDVLIRWNKMQGHSVSWIPGIDHAGIATQVIVERKLWKEKKLTRHDLGREHFTKVVWDWKLEKEKIITRQLKKLGVAINWDKMFFTLDSNRSAAVIEAFVRLHESGLIYRSNSLVNWSTIIKSAISDIEVDLMEVNGPTKLNIPKYEDPIEFGVLVEFACKIYGSDEEISVATTRVETMPGDVAIAVNPNDNRYTHLHGKMVLHPIRNTLIPIIYDDFVDPEFGTGAVKITPAHNNNDYLVGKRHNLEIIQAIDEDGKITSCCPQFSGLKRFEARVKILEELERQGLLREKKAHSMQVPFCSRSGDVLELLLKPQWFLNCEKMAHFAACAVKEGKLQINPSSFNNAWFRWLENSRDWCLSRQLWWGHQVPMYECRRTVDSNSTFWLAARSIEEAKLKASQKLGVGENEIVCEQDQDVLDTWFSSALLPFSSHGWPEMTKNFDCLYPLSVMATGNDILFFWVARMVMLGHELTGKLPFKKILLNGIICDADGRKMSKSLGNVISPEDVINGVNLQELHEQSQESFRAGYLSLSEMEKSIIGQKKLFPNGIPECGVDALRFTLCSHKTSNQFINFDVNECHTNRLFCNKIWQAAKYVWLCHKKYPQSISLVFDDENVVVENLGLMELWILSRLYETVSCIEDSLQNFDFYSCAVALKNFIYYEFCDIYLETTKETFRENDSKMMLDSINIPRDSVPQTPTTEGVLTTLRLCLGTAVKAVAPFMPFIAEELYQQFVTSSPSSTKKAESIFLTNYPKKENWERWKNQELEEKVRLMMEIVVVIRRLIATNGVKKKDSFCCQIELPSSDAMENLKPFCKQIQCLTHCGHLTFSKEKATGSQRKDSVALEFCTVHLFLPEATIPAKSMDQNQNLERERKLTKQLQKLIKTTESLSYKKQVPDHIQKAHTEKIIKLQEKIRRLQSA